MSEQSESSPINRRDFLKKAARVAIGVVGLGLFGASAPKAAASASGLSSSINDGSLENAGKFENIAIQGSPEFIEHTQKAMQKFHLI